MNEKLLRITKHLENKKIKEDAVKVKYKDKEKIKKLTTDERLTRIEEILNIV
jgi:hypothetical protein